MKKKKKTLRSWCQLDRERGVERGIKKKEGRWGDKYDRSDPIGGGEKWEEK